MQRVPPGKKNEGKHLIKWGGGGRAGGREPGSNGGGRWGKRGGRRDIQGGTGAGRNGKNFATLAQWNLDLTNLYITKSSV